MSIELLNIIVRSLRSHFKHGETSALNIISTEQYYHDGVRHNEFEFRLFRSDTAGNIGRIVFRDDSPDKLYVYDTVARVRRILMRVYLNANYYLHCETGPALTIYDDAGRISQSQYWQRGEIFRADGPAIFCSENGNIINFSYYEDGKCSKIISRNSEPSVDMRITHHTRGYMMAGSAHHMQMFNLNNEQYLRGCRPNTTFILKNNTVQFAYLVNVGLGAAKTNRVYAEFDQRDRMIRITAQNHESKLHNTTMNALHHLPASIVFEYGAGLAWRTKTVTWRVNGDYCRLDGGPVLIIYTAATNERTEYYMMDPIVSIEDEPAVVIYRGDQVMAQTWYETPNVISRGGDKPARIEYNYGRRTTRNIIYTADGHVEREYNLPMDANAEQHDDGIEIME
jgi:hypothetical protein